MFGLVAEATKRAEASTVDTVTLRLVAGNLAALGARAFLVSQIVSLHPVSYAAIKQKLDLLIE